MNKFEWLETFELRVPEIDGDHRAMLDLMKAVKTAARTGDRARAARYVKRLITFSKQHFQREEQFLKRIGYREAEIHARYHRDLYERAASMEQTCADMETPTQIEGCCDELMSFLIDDVVKGDLKLKSFFQETGVALPS